MSEAIRLLFVQEDSTVRLMSARRIKMRVPPGVKNPRAQVPDDAVGGWVELKDANGETIYRRFVSDLVRSDVHVTHTARGEPMRRVATMPRRHVFSVLVPYHDEAREVLVVERRRRPGARRAVEGSAGLETIRHAEIDLSRIDIRKEAEK